MKMDEYELELLDAVETATEFQRVENFEDELLEAKMAATTFKKKQKMLISVYRSLICLC